MSKSAIEIKLDRSTVRDLKRLLALASGSSIDGRVPVETTKAFALVALRRGISVMTEIYKRAELQTSTEARQIVIDALAPPQHYKDQIASDIADALAGGGDRLPQFDKGAQ